MTKAELRAEMLAVRRAAALASPDAAERLAAHWPAGLTAAVVAAYRPIRGEIDPGPLVRRLTAAGAPLCLPVTPPRGADAPLAYRLWSPGEPLIRSDFGVEEPGPSAPPASPDLILTPLLAFSREGGRLGWGQGHFDRTLAFLRGAGAITAIGLAYAAQERPDLPLEPHDEALDGILTEAAYIPVRKV